MRIPFLRDQQNVIILDVDGTLVDSNDAHARAWVDAFTEAGVLVDHEQVRRAIGMGGDRLVPHVSGLAEESPEGTRISERRSEIFTTRYLPHVQPFPAVRDLVQRFVDDGFRVVVASSANESELEGLLERAGVADLIEERTSSDDADRSKPDPDIVRAALRRVGVPAHRALMLGDTPYDVQAALRSGVKIVGVESGGWRRQELVGAAEVYQGAAELHERYDWSLFARFRSERQDVAATPPHTIDVHTVALIALGLGGLALLVLAARAFGRRRLAVIDEPVHDRRPGLSARDRERLRHLIEHTS